jgi:hypothetical protein
MLKRNKSYIIPGQFLGDVQDEPLAFTKVAVPYIKTLFSGIPIELRPRLINSLQNMVYSPEVSGIILPDIDMSNMKAGDVLKLWNAYQSLLIETIANSSADELLARFNKWFKIFGGNSLPEDVVKSLMENTDYSEIATGDGDIFPNYFGDWYDKLDAAMFSPEYVVGLNKLLRGQVGKPDYGLKAIADAMAGDITSLEGAGFLKKIAKKIGSAVAKLPKGVRALSVLAGVPSFPIGLAKRIVAVKKVQDPVERAEADKELTSHIANLGAIGASVREQGADTIAAKSAELDRILSPEVKQQIMDRMIDSNGNTANPNVAPSGLTTVIPPAATNELKTQVAEVLASVAAEGKPITQEVIAEKLDTSQIPIEVAPGTPYVYSVQDMGFMVSDVPLNEEIAAKIGATLVLQKDSEEALDLIHDLIEPGRGEGDISVPELVMIGHKISAALNLMKMGGMALNKKDAANFPQSRDSNPGGSLFTVGDVLLGDLIYTGCVKADPFKDYGELGAGDITGEGFLPMIASAAGAVAKPLLKLIGKSGIGKAVGGAAKKGAKAIGGGFKKLFKKKGGDAAKESLAKRVIKGGTGLVVGGLATDAALSGIQQLRGERAANEGAELEDVTKPGSMLVPGPEYQESQESIISPSSDQKTFQEDNDVPVSLGSFIIS